MFAVWALPFRMKNMAMPSKRRSAYRWVVLALPAFIYVLNFLDRQLLAILAKPIQDELGVSDGQLGLLGASTSRSSIARSRFLSLGSRSAAIA